MDGERKIYVNNDLDIVSARMQARAMAKELGFRTADQARISLAASELARVLSWSPNLPAEIRMIPTHQNGQQGLQVVCLVHLASEDTTDHQRVASQRSLSSACQLVDESIVEEQNNWHALVTLVKWLS
jgi:hypothetical protein